MTGVLFKWWQTAEQFKDNYPENCRDHKMFYDRL